MSEILALTGETGPLIPNNIGQINTIAGHAGASNSAKVQLSFQNESDSLGVTAVFTVNREDADLSEIFGTGETYKNFRVTVEELTV